jgi:hypothetical protein
MKRIAFIFIFILLKSIMFGQGFSFLTDNQLLIKKSLDSALFIIRQDYVLRNTSRVNPIDYGSEKNEYFGRIYRFAILSDNKLWCDSKISAPWIFDKNYQLLGKVDSIRPVLSKIAIRPLLKKHFQEFIADRKILSLSNDTIPEQLRITAITAKDLAKGVSVSHDTRDSSGWIVIAYTNREISVNDSTEIKLLIYRPNPGFKPNKHEVEIKAPPLNENILGGFYFTVKYSVGMIQLAFSGVLHQEKETWILSAIPNENLQNKSSPRLTPIKQSENSKQPASTVKKKKSKT